MYKLKKKKTWLVTGGAGFIGSNLINYLDKNNQKIICFDNFFSGTIKNINNIKSKNIKIINGDIRDLEKIKIKSKVHYLIHLAALGSVPRSFKNPIETNAVNVEGSIKVMILAKKLQCQKLIFASSSSVYGNSKKTEKKETDPNKPISPYGISKLTFEKYAEIFSNFYKLKTVGIRFFNVFGPNQSMNGPYSAVIPKWTKGLINKKKIYLNGDGLTTRDFTYVDNVVNGIILASQNDLKNYYEIFNLACGKEIKLNHLLDKLISSLNLKKKMIKIKYNDFKKGDIKKSKANIQKAKKNLNYIPLVNFDEGLKNYISFVINSK